MTPNLLKKVKRTVKDGSSPRDSRLEVRKFLPAAPVSRSCGMTIDLRQDSFLGIEETNNEVRTVGILRAARVETQSAILKFNCLKED